MSPLYRDYFNRKYIFQPSFFRGYVSLQGGLPVPLGAAWIYHSCAMHRCILEATNLENFRDPMGSQKRGKPMGKHMCKRHIKSNLWFVFFFFWTLEVSDRSSGHLFFGCFFGMDHVASWNSDHRFLLKLHNCTGLVQKGSERINVEEGISFLIGCSGTLVWLQTIGCSIYSYGYDDHGPWLSCELLQARSDMIDHIHNVTIRKIWIAIVKL